MAGIYDHLVAGASQNGRVKVPIWPLLITMRQYLEGDITAQTAASRFPGLIAPSYAELQTIATWARNQFLGGTSRADIFDTLWHTMAAAEFGYITEAQFKAKFGIS